MDIRVYEKMIEAVGAGAFGSLEYEGKERIVLRSDNVKTTEISGAVRLYFDNKRNQVMTGRRFEPMGLWFLKAGAVYKITTTIRVTEEWEGVRMRAILNSDAQDVMMILGDQMRVDDDGKLTFMVMPFRRIEMEKLTSLAYLEIEGPAKKEPVKKAPAKKKATAKVVKDEGNVSVKHPRTAKA